VGPENYQARGLLLCKAFPSTRTELDNGLIQHTKSQQFEENLVSKITFDSVVRSKLEPNLATGLNGIPKDRYGDPVWVALALAFGPPEADGDWQLRDGEQGAK
jgi:hypothetical protein